MEGNGDKLLLLLLAPPGRRSRGDDTGDSPTPPPLCSIEREDSPMPALGNSPPWGGSGTLGLMGRLAEY